MRLSRPGAVAGLEIEVVMLVAARRHRLAFGLEHGFLDVTVCPLARCIFFARVFRPAAERLLAQSGSFSSVSFIYAA